MIPNVNPNQMYVPPSMIPVASGHDYGQTMAPPVQTMAPPVGSMPVYNSIPYYPVYGNPRQAQQPQQFAPKISTVSIELNGLEPPKVPGFCDMQPQAPVYPGMTQLAPYQYQQPQYVPQMVTQTPVGINPPAPVATPPAPNYIEAPQQQIAPPPPAIDKAPVAPPAPQATTPQAPAAPTAQPNVQAAAQPSNPQQDQEAIKPLLDALSVICPKEGAPEATAEQQAGAIQTVAQFARVAEAANQLSKESPDKPEVKQTKEKVDNLIKPNLIKEETFLGLADIATKDTSKLAGEDKKKADENRVISMWTLAMLQKYFKQEMNEEAPKINIPPISMNEVPGIVQIVDIVKKDSNPDIREAGIAALASLADPKDKKDAETMKAILTEAQNDSAPNVKNAATEAYNNMFAPAQPQAPTVAAAPVEQPKQQ